MVDAVISTIVKRLTPVIAGRVRDEVNLVLNSQKEAENLVSKLQMIQTLLEDAEKKRVADRSVKKWLEKIEDAAYEMEDALDEWERKNLELEMEGSQQDYVTELFWEKVTSFIHSLCLCFQHSIERRPIALKMKELNGRLDLIAKENDDEFKFLQYLSEEKDINDSQAYKSPITNSLVDVSKVKGRDDVKNTLVSKLLSEGSEQGNDNVQIIALVGTGGLGKTTVAQLVFNDSQVEKHFPSKTWVCVSDPFNGIKIAKEILRSLNKKFEPDDAFETLVQLIKSSVARKRFLLVLDDVWTEDEKNLTDLKLLFRMCAPGSRILVTTRKDRVAKMMGAQIQPLHLLSDSDCWSVMSQKAFLGGKKENHEILEHIGQKIAKKCHGLPLAAITLGSLLYEKDTVEEWDDVLNDEVWNLDIARDKIFPPIYLSYKELDLPVKRCFSYCAIFPKDSKMEADTLIRIWMAHGFLSGGSAEKRERKGRDYLKKLVALSFFQDFEVHFKSYVTVSYKVHDIIHDFAQFVTEGECFSLEIGDDIVTEKNVPPNASHLAWRRNRKASSKPVLNCNFEKLRSFFSNDYDCLPPAGVGTLKCVRVLNLSDCGLQELPPEIGNLIHLRYLDLNRNHLIRELPISLCHLYKLQTLILLGLCDLCKLPEEIYKLKELRHLLVKYPEAATFFPPGLKKLTGLGTLNFFRAGSGGSKLGYLKDLNQLEGNIEIIIDDADVIEARNAELKKKNSLRSLALDFRGEVRMDVMEALEPPPKLSHLYLRGFYVGFPHWISNTSLNNLKTLRINVSSSLPPLGNLQSLENLYIWFNQVKYLEREFLRITDRRAFPKLKTLVFNDCPDWTEWEDIREEEENVVSIMPCLKRLYVENCPRLKSLPRHLLRSRQTPLEDLNIYGSDLLIEQYKSGELGEKELAVQLSLSPTNQTYQYSFV